MLDLESSLLSPCARSTTLSRLVLLITLLWTSVRIHGFLASAFSRVCVRKKLVFGEIVLCKSAGLFP